ncbi:16S rRNA (adenine(1518)-N(6)/adenine(1519)-N(6))-dimethyltransferase RsmA [Rhodococcus sp. NPDC049939]|uniref:16S rRNA (adenine(1518)-N(6)/adenine(1519)-N(6))- dimethyltransferase RsmA n=1 Tax=Rhodococcus sp. NPDC049939 TaxID=3155511 RepID=UPI0033FEB57D
MSDAEVPPVARGRAALLGPAEVRSLAEAFGVRPTKQLGQNFVHDANTVRRIVATAGVDDADRVLEVGPGLGSLTLALLDVVDKVIAVEVDPNLAARLPETVADRAPQLTDRLAVVGADAMRIAPSEIPGEPTALVANLPYNVAVPVLLHLLSELPSLRTALVMVQAEVADRLAAKPGSKTYGAPSVKANFFGDVRRAGAVGRAVFWPVPKVESGLVRIDRYVEPPWPVDEEARRRVFAVIDAAFAQRRKTLRAALGSWAGSPTQAERRLREAGIEPSARGETLDVAAFVRLAATQP